MTQTRVPQAQVGGVQMQTRTSCSRRPQRRQSCLRRLLLQHQPPASAQVVLLEPKIAAPAAAAPIAPKRKTARDLRLTLTMSWERQRCQHRMQIEVRQRVAATVIKKVPSILSRARCQRPLLPAQKIPMRTALCQIRCTRLPLKMTSHLARPNQRNCRRRRAYLQLKKLTQSR